MSFPLSSLPSESLSAAPADTSALLCGLPTADPGASFESVLTQAAPAEKNADPAIAESEDSSEESPSHFGASSSGPAPFTAEQLAAVLAFLGSSAAQSPLPPAPLEPVNFDFTCTTAPAANDATLATEPLGSGATVPFGNSTRLPFAGALASGAPSTTARPPREWSARAVDTAAAPAPVPGTASFLQQENAPISTPSPTPSARELVEAGADLITYQLVPSPKGGAEPAVFAPLPESTPLTKLPELAPTDRAPAPPATVVSPVTPETQLAALTGSLGVPLTASPAVAKSDLRPAARVLAKAGRENIAAPISGTSSNPPSGVKSSISILQNNFLSVDGQPLPGLEPIVGTTIANWGESMRPETQSQLVSRVVDAAVSTAGFSALVPQASTAEAPKSAPHAAQIVREIRDIADGLWAVERNTVEVRFNFSDTERLSVRVEYREGVVKTTFQTNSPELRDTLAREWQSQPPVAESRAYRVADPVFSTPPADARGFSLGGDASRQQRQSEQPAQPAFYLPGQAGRAPAGRDTSSVATPSSARAENSVHLQAFA